MHHTASSVHEWQIKKLGHTIRDSVTSPKAAYHKGWEHGCDVEVIIISAKLYTCLCPMGFDFSTPGWGGI